MPDPTTPDDDARPEPAATPGPKRVTGLTRSRAILIGALVAALVAASVITWVTTRALHHDHGTRYRPFIPPVSSAPVTVIDLAQQATDAMFSFTAETAPGNIKSARALLCGKAFDDFDALAAGGRLTAELSDSDASADIADDRYAITQQDQRQAQVLVFFVRNFTDPNSGTGRVPSKSYALRYTVDTTALPMCINSIELLS